MADVSITVTGLDKVVAAFGRFPSEAARYLEAAGKEGAEEVLNTEGLRRHPAAGPGNAPPTPYYVRGRGTQYAGGNDGRSERYGTQFYVEPRGYVTAIGNRASYAKYLANEPPAAHMARIGWRSLLNVAEEKKPALEGIYQRWVDKLLRDMGLT